ncbi:23S rRNA (uracil(1939)-C(5))-methyltransferase RlmD [Candidatus Sumerlaeota bacterium]|nr:23S rRNA (uracil(1939)-C(5))-methyltransferase RlmD [Candidatus Sumerlaeota bacterium]
MAADATRSADKIQRETALELTVEDLAYGGQGIGRIGGFVVFVDQGVPGDRLRVRVTRRRKNHAEARIEEILSPSPHRIVPPCPLFGECGGCTWQNLPYEQQLVHKQRQAEATLQHLGAARPERIESIVASPREWRYRNKMDYTFGTDAEGNAILGFHRPGQFSKILEVPKCLLQPEPMDAILGAMTRWVRSKKLTAHDPLKHTGFLRHLILRHSVASDEYIALLLTREGELPDPPELVEALREACPRLKGFVWGVNAGLADVAKQDREVWRWGEPQLDEKIGHLTFRVSPLSFFQVNTPAAERLYGVVRDMVPGDGSAPRLLDAYCGTGTIGLFCADKVRDLVGIELLRDAIWDARANAERNGIANCTFLAGNMREALPLAASMPGGDFGCVIMDPPRGGMDKRSLKGLLALRAPRMIYVSCNPSTLARDLVEIVGSGYRPALMQPVDLFPQTFHIETVIRFDREESAR